MVTKRKTAPPTPPVITRQPIDQTVNVGQAVTLMVQADGRPAPQFQWQRKNSMSGTWNDIRGENTNIYTTPALTMNEDGDLYRCLVSNPRGSVTSDVATLTVTNPQPQPAPPPQNPPPPQPTPPAITREPIDQIAIVGQTVTLEVQADGVPAPQFQWQFRNPLNNLWQDIPGATNNIHTTPTANMAYDGARFRCVVSNSSGSVTSDVATLTLEKFPWGKIAWTIIILVLGALALVVGAIWLKSRDSESQDKSADVVTTTTLAQSPVMAKAPKPAVTTSTAQATAAKPAKPVLPKTTPPAKATPKATPPTTLPATPSVSTGEVAQAIKLLTNVTTATAEANRREMRAENERLIRLMAMLPNEVAKAVAEQTSASTAKLIPAPPEAAPALPAVPNVGKAGSPTKASVKGTTPTIEQRVNKLEGQARHFERVEGKLVETILHEDAKKALHDGNWQVENRAWEELTKKVATSVQPCDIEPIKAGVSNLKDRMTKLESDALEAANGLKEAKLRGLKNLEYTRKAISRLKAVGRFGSPKKALRDLQPPAVMIKTAEPAELPAPRAIIENEQ